MTTWQLDPTGRFPQACFDWVKAQQPESVVEAMLLAGDWLIANGFYYENNDEARLTGIFGFVDCSGFVVLCTNVARAVMGRPAMNVPGNSALQSRACHDLPRPQSLIDRFGPGQGYVVTAAQARGEPGALAFHGDREGQDGFGDGGHVLTKYFIEGHPHAGWNASIEAAGHAADLIYSTFDEPADTCFAISPWLDGFLVPDAAPEPKEKDDVLTFQQPNKAPDSHGNTPHVRFQPALEHPAVPFGGLVLVAGANIEHSDRKGDTRFWMPPVVDDPKNPRVWVSAFARASGIGMALVDNMGHTTKPEQGHWND